MKKLLFSMFFLLLALPMTVLADGFDALWKQAEEARKKDLPKTEMAVLEKIVAKAETDKAYGHLLKAELRSASITVEIAPDSLKTVISKFEQKAEALEKTNGALAAVYNIIIGKIYKESRVDDEDKEEKSKEYFRRAFKDREMLATHKAVEYEPMVLKGAESRYFDNDLFSMLGFEAEAYHKMHKFYSKKGNRVATMYLALKIIERDYNENRDDFYPNGVRNYDESLYKAKLDSLINEYGDLQECGEVAIALFEYMNGFRDVPVARKMQFIDDALSRWGSWMSMDKLRNYRSQFTQPMFRISAEKDAVLPGKVFRIPVATRNMKTLTLTVTKTTLEGDTRLNPENANEYKKIKSLYLVNGTARTITRDYSDKKEYETTNDTIDVEGLPVGVYLLVFDAPKSGTQSRRCLLYVTDMFVLNMEQPENTRRFVVVSAETGQPVPDARIELLYEGRKTETLKCGADGEVTSKVKDYNRLRAVADGDKACPFVSSWNRFSYYGEAKDRDVVNLYTDRGIYRPGQTVHVSAISFRNERGKELSALAGREMTLTLRDANHRVVKEEKVKTDDFGNASAQFVLPSTGLTGRFSISSDIGNRGNASFRVEEYKRPTFRVEFDEVKEAYANGDTITVTGRATTFAGVPVQGAAVDFTVERNCEWWWRYNDNGNNDTMAEGETVTEADGTFKVRVPMVLPVLDAKEKYESYLYEFTTTAEVTDLGGETHCAELSLALATKPLILSCNMSGRIERDSLKDVTFNLRNAAGTSIPGTVKYYIDNPKNEYTAEAGKPVTLQWGEGLKATSGKHLLVAYCEGDTVRTDFVLYSFDDTVPCCETDCWDVCSKRQFPNDGRPVYVQIGSSQRDVHVVYSLIAGNKVLENGTFRLDNSVMTRKFEYKEEYGDGITYSYGWVKDGKSYRNSHTISRPMPDKNLRMKWTTFRDRLTPGQKETWTLNVTNPDGTPANAHLLAVMYDKSLDDITPHSWSFRDMIQLNYAFASWSDIWFNGMHYTVSKNYNPLKVNEMSFNRLDFRDCWPLMRGNYYGVRPMEARQEVFRMSRAANAKMMKAEAVVEMAAVEEDWSSDGALQEVVTVATGSMNVNGKVYDVAPFEEEAAEEEETGGATVQVRENLNETAFFYPALVADDNGDVAISFTLPESLTTWKFMGLAYDKTMNNGLITSEAVAKKDIMVQPNVPRFVRQGDNAVITARIMNTSENVAAGTARILLIDPETEKTVFEQKQKFSVEAGQTGVVSFFKKMYDVEASIYICKVLVEGPTFSDGEQHYLPVLPNTELVTNTLPFTILEKGKKTLDIGKLMPQDNTSKKLTVEYAANPAWLMVQALPFVGNPNEENAISLAAAYYANSLASNIIGMSPEIEKVFKQWQQEQSSENSLMSSLQKNEELKSIALDETPWVMDADKEADRKAAIANFFDKNTLNYNIDKTLTALRKLQNSDGSFSWWKGMGGSMYMTATVMEFIARLDATGAGRSETRSMMNNAAKYLGEQVVKEVAEAKKYMKKGAPTPVCSSAALQFAYINALTGRKLSAKETAAEEFVIKGYDESKRDQSLYVKAVMAYILSKKQGKTEQAKEYAQSLKEYTVYKEEMGRYYDTPRAGYSWCSYRIPTQTMAIEALLAVNPQDAQTIDEMRRWLLQEKRTQAWDTPINSVNAVYAFLKGNANALTGDNSADISVDGKQMTLPKATAGIGYVKAKSDVTSAKAMTIDKRNGGTSWGAVYVQFMQPSNEVQDAASGLSVTREIIGKENLKVGDRIKVRLTITADRDYDFVQVSDKRAACLEPVGQLSGYRGGYYIAPKDNATYYYFDMMRKGKHVIETEYYVDRKGTYQTGTCTVQCAYSPEFMARTAAHVFEINE